MRVLIAPDKFKGSLTAAAVADHLAKGIAEAGAQSRTLPLADGGAAASPPPWPVGSIPFRSTYTEPPARSTAVQSLSTSTPQSSRSPTPAG